MERHMRREAQKAHKQEMKAERREERLHFRAVNAAFHGNLGKAARLETRSQAAGIRAEDAHQRQMSARSTANAIHHSHHPHYPPHHPHPNHYPHCPPPVVHYPHPPRPAVHVVHHYPSAPPPVTYTTGVAPPPPPVQNPYYPSSGYPTPVAPPPYQKYS
ncbi:uncharacterized protein LOC143470986 [Clavelina lepadiformis]|uniref:Uncharacterized protein n=1 Tax=Clavelina lepadiformis TaxID=159417 RepID=A0ABP0FXZ4_CLALP